MIPRYTREEMGRVWSDANKFARWLDVELAATETLAEAGLVPKDAAALIRARAKVDALLAEADSGRSWDELFLAEPSPLLVEVLTTCVQDVIKATSRYRRAEAQVEVVGQSRQRPDQQQPAARGRAGAGLVGQVGELER